MLASTFNFDYLYSDTASDEPCLHLELEQLLPSSSYTKDEDLSLMGYGYGFDAGSPFTASSPSSSGEDDPATYLFDDGLHSSSPQLSSHQLPWPQSSTSPQAQPTMTVAPSDLSRPVSPSISDPTPPPTTYLPAVRAVHQSHSSLNDPDPDSNCDDNDKDEDYKPESDPEPPFGGSSSSGNRKRSLSFDEYIPEIFKKKPRTSGPARRPTPKNAIKLPSAKLARARRSVKRTRVSPPPRNAQVDSTTAEIIEELLNSKKKGTPITDWRCPGCTFYQYNHRLQDFQRHMTSHLGKIISCIGVPLSEAEQYGISPNAQHIKTDKGELRVGGCEEKFSRDDAYKRHVANPNNDCIAVRKGGRAH